jgi:hypothetical protein
MTKRFLLTLLGLCFIASVSLGAYNGNGPFTISSSPGTGSTGSGVPATANYEGVNVGGNLTGRVGDPCEVNAPAYKPVNITANTQVVTGTSGKQTYICGWVTLPTAAAVNVAIVEGTGTVCATNTTGVIGGSTTATGANIATNGGFVLPVTGKAYAATATLADNVCIFAAAQTSGVLVTVQQ